MEPDKIETATDCGCDDKKAENRERLKRAREARGKRKTRREPFKAVASGLDCLCRDSFGKLMPCSCEGIGR